MKCPKCGYQSFNNLAACKKCGRDLTELQAKFNFGSPVVAPAPIEKPEAESTEIPTEPAVPPPTPGQVSSSEAKDAASTLAEEDGEEMLEDFFQSIDKPHDDRIPPSASSATKPSKSGQENHRVSASEVADDFPQWDQPSAQGDFPFDELDADLDVLRLASSPEKTLDDSHPFDDVDDFEIDWQSPAEDRASADQEPTVAETAESKAKSAEYDSKATEQSAQESLEQLQPAEETSTTEAALPAADAEASEPEPAEQEWPLPKLPSDHEAEESFSLTESLEEPPEAQGPEPAAEEPPAAQEPERAEEEPESVTEEFLPGSEVEAAAEEALPEAVEPPPDLEEQIELPIAAQESGQQVKPAAIAAVFLPGAAQDPLAAGALLLARRAKAYLADSGLLAAIFVLFICAGEIARLPAAEERFRFTSDVVLDLAAPYFLVFFALCFGYFTFFHYLCGQTPGKMLFDVRVEGDDHAGITLAQAFLRCVGGLIALLPAGLGYLSIVLDRDQRGWNDRLAGCRVTMVEEEEGV